MQYAAVIEVDNSHEDPEVGRVGLRRELLPVLRQIPGFDSTLLMTAYEHGRGMAVVVFDTREAAQSLLNSMSLGQNLRDGVTVTGLDILEVTARG